MATSQIPVSSGIGVNVATNSISEDALTKQLSRNVLNNSSGTEIGTTTNPIGVSVIGALPITITGNPSISGTVNIGTMPGSVVSFQGTSPWVVQSIVGTYAEDAASAGTDKGLFVLGVRNDTVASLVSADLDYGAMTTDSAGRTLIKPFSAEEARVEGYASVVSTSVTTLVAAAGTGLRNYITDFWVVNTGGTTTLITFKDGLGSVLGYTVAPTGSGSNSPGINMPIRTGANASFDFQAASASSVIYATVKGYKGP